MSGLRSVSAVLALLAIVACAPAGGAPGPGSPEPVAATTVTVTNDNARDVAIYVTRSSMRFRLGTVPSMDVRSFTIPRSAIAPAGTIRLVADPAGLSAPYATEPIPVVHGQALEFRVRRRLSSSYFSILAR